MSMWYGLRGPVQYQAGASGTVTLPYGSVVLQIKAGGTSAGTISIFGGSSIPTLANTLWELQEQHTLLQAGSANNTIVFTTTTTFYVEYMSTPGSGV
jgi:hypothetical protein